jgi:hypothetical protein
LGAASSARVGERRTGYRHGHRERTLSTGSVSQLVEKL